HLAYIRKGLVKICINEHDEEMLLSVEKRGSWIGLHALSPATTYPYSAYACEEVEVCLFNIGSINAFIQNNASFGSALMKLINESAVLNYQRMASVCLKQVHGKFADLMLFLSLSIYKKTEFTTSLSKKDMASLTNMSPESFSRVLKDFIKDKIMSYEGDHITIIDYKKMRKISVSG
ncbi:MAG TPA: Crp/Fnr family transcriptional regulator, partial [Chitinophagaceae bacterium]|nr:Crp/Fnr family transcriptional regulator [Chitinophagaceae bacterium]